MEIETYEANLVNREISFIEKELDSLQQPLKNILKSAFKKDLDKLSDNIDSIIRKKDEEAGAGGGSSTNVQRQETGETKPGKENPALVSVLETLASWKRNAVCFSTLHVRTPVIKLDRIENTSEVARKQLHQMSLNLKRKRLAALNNRNGDNATNKDSCSEEDDLFTEVVIKRPRSQKKPTNGFNTTDLPAKRIRKQIIRPDFISTFKKSKMERGEIKMEIKQEEQACSSNEGDSSTSTSTPSFNGNGGIEFPCPVCKKIFRKKGHMTRHLLTHEPEKPFGCDFCSKRFAAKYSLQMHLLNRHNTDAKPFECEDCDKRFTLKKELDAHKATHKEGYKPKTYPCHLCELKFINKDDLDSHLETHPEANVYHCGHCDKSFPRKYNLTRHERTHSTEKPYHCDVCNKDFGTKNGLHMHLQAHEADSKKPYVCRLCDKRFTVEQNLELHISYHNQSEDKPFSCDLCEVRFKSQERLEKHFETHGSSEGRIYPCQYCDKTFPRKYNLIRHELSHTHGRRKPKDGMPTSRFNDRNGDDDDSDDENNMITGTGGDENSILSHESESMQGNNVYFGLNSLSKSDLYTTFFGLGDDLLADREGPPPFANQHYKVVKFENY